jgi:hypothetical protein
LFRELWESRAEIPGREVLRDEIRGVKRSQVSKDLVSHEHKFGHFP